MDNNALFLSIADIFALFEENRWNIFAKEKEKSVNSFFETLDVSNHLDDRFFLLIPKDFFKNEGSKNSICKDTQIVLNNTGKKKSRSTLSNLHTGTNGKTKAKSCRETLASNLSSRKCSHYIKDAQEKFMDIFPSSAILETFSLNNLPMVKKELLKNVITVESELHARKCRRNDLHSLAENLVFINKALLYIAEKCSWGLFFWGLLIRGLFQEEVDQFKEIFSITQYEKIYRFLCQEMPNASAPFQNQLEGVPEDVFWTARREIVKSAQGEISIAGPSLKDALSIDFSKSDSHSIVDQLQNGIRNKQLTHIRIFITDPEMFDGIGGSKDAVRDITNMLEAVRDNLCELCEINQVHLSIFFLPMLQIDHAVITEELMAFRSNKLWNRDRLYKGSFVIYLADYYSTGASEYKAHLDYLNALEKNSTTIYPDFDINETVLSKMDFSARYAHMQFRTYLKRKGSNFTRLYKIYEKQIHSYVCDTWRNENYTIGDFIPSDKIVNRNQLFEPQKLLGDETQQVLLPYLEQTEILFNIAIRKHDNTGLCKIYPSLDLGFPNNIQRLAGGFATGMLVTWKCGIDIVPIDATVNVCTSSVFRLDGFDIKRLDNKQEFTEYLNRKFHLISQEKGYSFSFCSGNHFFIIAQEEKSDTLYLVLHSSANELKKSFMGLYPVEGNWYSKEIKSVPVEELRERKAFYKGGSNWWSEEKLKQVASGRYFRYLKDAEASHFIRMAHNFKMYNEQIHRCLGLELTKLAGNQDFPTDFDPIVKHHYYMPNDHTIALGTFAEEPKETVPIFSASGKPIYLFKIGENNWKVNLGDGKLVCLIPHGWGQAIDCIQEITHNSLDNELQLHIKGQNPERFHIESSKSLNNVKKHLRQFNDCKDFMNQGAQMIDGRVIKTLIPLYEYSANTIRNDKYIEERNDDR